MSKFVSNLGHSWSPKETKRRGAVCWKCGTTCWSTKKSHVLFGWVMDFRCSKCGDVFTRSISDCFE